MKGWVLAGGRSSRFGSDKAQHLVHGVPMVRHIALRMQEAGLEVQVIARDRRLDRWWPVLVEDPGPVHPLNGLVAGLRQGGGVFAPCDLPFFPVEGFRRLMKGGIAESSPLLGFYDPSWLPRAEATLARQGSVRAFAEGAPTVTFPDPWLRNVNRPEDL